MPLDGDTTVVMSRPVPARPVVDRLVPPTRRLGPATIAVLALALAGLWLAIGPATAQGSTDSSGQGWASFVGQLAGAEAVLAMSVSLVLISTLPWVETWFDGIDRTAIWHRRLALTGMLLLVPHLMLSDNHGASAWSSLAGNLGLYGMLALVVWAVLPRWRAMLPAAGRRAVAGLEAWTTSRRLPAAALDLGRRVLGPYERWRTVHRLTGLFVAAGFAHGLGAASTFGSGWLRWSYVAIGGIGLVFYGYRELLAGRFLPLHDYQVAAVTPVAPGVAELTLSPIGAPVRFSPGQFAMVFLEGKHGWHRHPFTFAGASHDRQLTFTIKGLGDHTREITHTVRVGMPAVVGGPHGRFLNRRGTDEQIWVAGGIGVTPFLSWLRSLSREPITADVHFFYVHTGPAPYADQIHAITRAHPRLRVHIIDSAVEGHLSVDRILDTARTDPSLLSAFLCGPTAMVNTLSHDLRRAGVAGRHIHREHFDWR